MRTLILSSLFLLFILACGSKEESAASEKVAKTEKPDGQQIYKNLCVACHGLYGDMGASGAFNLQTSALNLEERIAVITNGRNTMTPFGSMLKEEEIKAVAEYTLKLKK
ncbi:MAG TPA: cytochrome c [Saprospiraceae bacterium]|nr:cytochrome c [Saprospiraceae bacterium]HMQ84029.1 cytochrome c [Saprospiraceae bacterium]